MDLQRDQIELGEMKNVVTETKNLRFRLNNTLNPTGAQLQKKSPPCGRYLKDGPMQILLFHSPEKVSVSFFFQTLLEPR